MIRLRTKQLRTQRVPGRLDVISDPVVDRLVVLLGVHDIIMHLLRIVRVAGLVPRAHVDPDRQAVREKLLCGLKVDVVARRGRVRVEVRVMRGELTAEAWSIMC